MYLTLLRQYASQLHFKVQASKTYFSIVLIISFPALLSIYLLSSELVLVKLFLSIVFVISTLYTLKNNRQRELSLQSDGTWLIKQNGQKYIAELSSGSVVTPFFTVMNLKLENRKNLNLLLFRDNINPDAFRQLRVRLKVEGHKSQSRDTLLP